MDIREISKGSAMKSESKSDEKIGYRTSKVSLAEPEIMPKIFQ